MRFAAPFVALVAVASALPSELVPRATDLTQQILANLTTTQNDAGKLNTTINAQKPGNTAYTTAQLVAIVQASSLLSNDINSTAGTANKSAVASQSNSKLVYDQVNNNLRPVVFSVLDNLDAHYPNFKLTAGNQVPQVKTTLQNLRELTRQLSNALVAKAVAPYIAQGQTLRDTILKRYDTSITKFSS